MFRSLAVTQEQRTKEIARKHGIQVPLTFHRFFDVARSGNWPSVSNYLSHCNLTLEDCRSKTNALGALDVLGQPAYDTFQAFQFFAQWPTGLVSKYVYGILDSVSPGSICFYGTDSGHLALGAFAEVEKKNLCAVSLNSLINPRYLAYLRDRCEGRMLIPSNVECRDVVQCDWIDRSFAGMEVPETLAQLNPQTRTNAHIMRANAILARRLFRDNADKTFFLDEGYVVPWMYPYLEPHGLLMTLNTRPLSAISSDVVQNDMSFWARLVSELLADPTFLTCPSARVTFSKLRCGIAGVYDYRGLHDSAETAYKQALALCPDSREANMRLVECYMHNGNISEARALLKQYRQCSPDSAQEIDRCLAAIAVREQLPARTSQLEARLFSGEGMTGKDCSELASAYACLGQTEKLRNLACAIVAVSNTPPQVYLYLARICASSGDSRAANETIEAYLLRNPGDITVWADLIAAYVNEGEQTQALNGIKRSIEVNGNKMRDILRLDARLSSLRDNDEFKQLLASEQEGPTRDVPNRAVETP